MNKIAELKAHYNRGWESDEDLRRLPKRLNEEQASLHLDGVTIDNDDKFSHYIRELYRSDTFTDKTVIKWNNNLTTDQTYANTIIFFKNKKYGMDKVYRFTGNTNLGNNGFSSANSAIEWGNKVKDIITKSVTTAIQQKNNKHAFALTEIHTTIKRELQKYCKRSPPSARELTESPPEREIKEAAETTKAEAS